MLARIILIGALAFAASACGPSAQNTRAASGLQNYLAALRGSDPRPVYEMLSAKERKELSYEQWAKLWKESKAERSFQAEEIEKRLVVQQPVDEAAHMRFEDGRTITLARSPKGWRLNQALLGRSRAEQPEDAINLFANALRERDVGNLLQVFSKRHRTRIEARLQALSRGLADELAKDGISPYLINEARAELTWNYEGLRYKIALIKEDGEWVIDDVHMGPDPTVDPEEADAAADRPPLELLRRR